MIPKGVVRGGARWAGWQGAVPSPALVAGARLRAEGGPVGQAAEEAEAEEEGQADHGKEQLVLEVELCQGEREVARCCHRHLEGLLLVLFPLPKTEATVSIHTGLVPHFGDLAPQQPNRQVPCSPPNPAARSIGDCYSHSSFRPVPPFPNHLIPTSVQPLEDDFRISPAGRYWKPYLVTRFSSPERLPVQVKLILKDSGHLCRVNR